MKKTKESTSKPKSHGTWGLRLKLQNKLKLLGDFTKEHIYYIEVSQLIGNHDLNFRNRWLSKI